MKKKPVLILLGVFIIIVAAWLVYNYAYNKPHRQINSENPDISLLAHELFNSYSADEARADSFYLNKVIQVEGAVEKILTNEQGIATLVLEGAELFGISCAMDESEKQKVSQIKVGNTVKIKGLCNGMLMDVVLVKCTLVE